MFRTAILAAAALGIASVAAATPITVGYSEDFAEKLVDDYGEREGARLSDEVIKDVTREFERQGVDVARVEVTIIDAKPNRPTFEQLSARPGLDAIRSISIGGMDLHGKAFDASGELIAETQYDWFENDITLARGAGTWTDANRASNRFARRFAEDISESGQ